MKYTDAEIEKALKCCANKKQCSDCPFCVTSREPCYITLAREAASLLVRRDAKIESLKKELIEQQLKNNLLYETAKEIRAEAIKEFAELLKRRMGFCDLPNGIVRSHIDNLAKEMTEGENERIQQETAEADSTGGSNGGNDRLRGTL